MPMPRPMLLPFVLALALAACQVEPAPDAASSSVPSEPETAVPEASGAPAPVADADCPAGAVCGSDAERLRALGVPVAVPAYLPEGTALERVDVTPGATSLEGYSGQGALASYALHFRTGGACFAVEGDVLEGLGGPEPSNALGLGWAPAFPQGDPPLQVFWTDGGEDGFPMASLYSDFLFSPLTEPVGYRVTSYEEGDCARLDPAEAARVARSLTFLQGTISEDAARYDEGMSRMVDQHGFVSVTFNRPFAERDGRDRAAFALAVLDEIGMRPAPESAETAVREHVQFLEVGPSTVSLVLEQRGGGDDSVAGRRVRLDLMQDGDDDTFWTYTVGEQWACARGSERDVYAPRYCP